MNKKKLFFIIAGVAILIVIILLIWQVFFLKKAATLEQTSEPKRLPVGVSINTNTSAIVIKEAKTEADLKTIARTFAERFGSYSNETNFQNLADIRDFMTPKMKSWADGFIAEQKAGSAKTGDYYGIIVNALSVTVTSFDETIGRAEVVVNTQKLELVGSTANPKIFYQELLLKLVNSSNGWKVDEAIWK